MLPFLPPMLASSGRPRGPLEGWVVEPKADGWRAQVAVGTDRVLVRTRTGRDITAKVPELSRLAGLGVECVLDGELVAGAGLPSDFYGIAGLVSSRHGRAPLTFVAFDILCLAGDPLIELPYTRRRQLLEQVVQLSEGALMAVNTFPGADLDDVLHCCEELEMEGVVVKRADARYRPRKRTADWRKVKCAGWREQHADRRLS